MFWLVLGSAAIADAHPPAQRSGEATRVAVLAADSPNIKNLAALVEITLGRIENCSLLDRADVDRVLKEQQLQAMFAPSAAPQREALGQLLKADLLVMLREERRPQKHIELAICETRQGLRLAFRPLPSGQSPDALVAAASVLVRQARAKARAGVATIVAVPPLVDDSLSFDNTYLMPAYARLIEQALIEQPGVVVAELSEAEAIARETALAGGAVARPLPIIVRGRYRAEMVGGKPRLSLHLAIERGGHVLGEWRSDTLSRDGAPAELRKAAIALLAKIGPQPLAPSDGAGEAAALAASAKAFLDVGYYREALSMIEASLMLRPRQPDLAGQAVAAIAPLIDDALFGEKMPDAARAALALRKAQLRHAESFALETKLGFTGGAEVFLRGEFRRFHASMHSLEMAQRGHRFPPEIAAAWQSCRDEEAEMIDRVLRAKSEADVQDTAIFCLGGDPTEYWEKTFAAGDAARLRRYQDVCRRQLDLCRRFAYLTLPKIRTSHWQMILPVPPPPAGAAQWQIYLGFLNELHQLPNATLADLAKVEIDRGRGVLQRGAPDFAASAVRASVPRDATGMQPATIRSIIVRPIELAVDDSPPHPLPASEPIQRWLPAGRDAELLIAHGRCYLVKGRGHAAPIAAELSIDGPKAIFDGRFDWVFGRRGEEPLLAVVDPVDGKAVQFTAETGLPTTGYVAALAALAPGRVCAVGNSGGERQGRRSEDRTWIAIAAFSLAGDKTFHVFHVARKVPGGGVAADDANVSFRCLAMSVIARPAAGGKLAERRILIARGIGLQSRVRPLVIDPDKLTVAVLPFPIDATRACVLGETSGAFCWIDDLVPPLNAEGTLYRLGLPELSPLALNRRVPARGEVFFDGERLFARSQEEGKACWYMADRASDPLRKLGITGNEPAQFAPLCRSVHYGLVELTNPPLEIVLP